MATRSSTFSIRLSVKDQAAASRALKNLGADGDKALTRVEKAARRNSAEFKRLKRSQRELTTGMQGLTRSLGPVGGALSALGPAGISGVSARGKSSEPVAASNAKEMMCGTSR